MKEAIISLDVGTTVTKAIAFDLSGAELAVVEQAYRLHTPRPGWAELDPEEIWEAVLHVLGVAVDAVVPAAHIRALALATQGGSLIPARDDGTPTYRAITWMDGRAHDVVARWRADGLGDRIRQISGWSPEPGLPLPSIAWLREARPELFAISERFLSVDGFVVHRLTGHFATNPSMAGEMLLADITSGEWSEELCRLVGIRPGHLSPVRPSGAPLGKIRPEVSDWTGLDPETVVINGGQDHACELLALGMMAAGTGMLACGTAWVLNGIVASPSVDSIPPAMSLNHHVLPGRWVVSQFLGGLGACLEWWLHQCGPAQGAGNRSESWAAFNASLEETQPGCGGLLYFPQTGMRNVPEPVRQGGFAGLRLDHSRADMGRAIMEGAAYELRWALEHLREAGLAVESLWMIGGATRSPLWPQIVADVTGVPVSLSQYTHGPALGAAILAGVGLGLWDSVEAGRDRFRVAARRIEPGADRIPVYDAQFAAYRQAAWVLAQ